jgi:hypothetical protein
MQKRENWRDIAPGVELAGTWEPDYEDWLEAVLFGMACEMEHQFRVDWVDYRFPRLKLAKIWHRS